MCTCLCPSFIDIELVFNTFTLLKGFLAPCLGFNVITSLACNVLCVHFQISFVAMRPAGGIQACTVFKHFANLGFQGLEYRGCMQYVAVPQQKTEAFLNAFLFLVVSTHFEYF